MLRRSVYFLETVSVVADVSESSVSTIEGVLGFIVREGAFVSPPLLRRHTHVRRLQRVHSGHVHVDCGGGEVARTVPVQGVGGHVDVGRRLLVLGRRVARAGASRAAVMPVVMLAVVALQENRLKTIDLKKKTCFVSYV